VDFVDTWAPTARQATARLMLHLAAALDFHVHAMDVDQAFLQGDLEEEIYMEPPLGFAPLTPGHVWRLHRPLYGLRQSPRQWHAKLKATLLKLGFKPSFGDPSLFVGECVGVWMLVYVDDLLIMSQSLHASQELKEALKAAFPMKDLGAVTSYLGMDISRDWSTKQISLSQRKHIDSLVTRFGAADIKTYETPLAVNHCLTLPSDEDAPHPDQDRFPELLGGIMYLMVCTRPDIAHAVSVLSRFIATGRHGPTHWRAALRLLGYLKHTADYKLTLGGNITTLTGFSDSSWADNLIDRHSSQGFCVTLGSGVISWRANRSPAVALSTCEAELYAGTAAAQELLWLTYLLGSLGQSQDSVPLLWCDNQSTVALTKDPIYSARSKHIEARYFFIRELVQGQRLRTAHIPSYDNVADIFTKPLSHEDHSRLPPLPGLQD